MSVSINKKRILLFGVGWLGTELLRELSENDYLIHIATRNISKWSSFDDKIEQIHFLSNTYDLHPAISNISFDIICVMLPPSNIENYVGFIKKICKQSEQVKQFIFTSSTGVYQNKEGHINEESIVNEQHVVYKAEQEVKKAYPKACTILRLSGLISEDRHPTKYLLKKNLIEGGRTPVNLVHRRDVLRVIMILFEVRGTGEIFNISYPNNPSRKEYYSAFAKKYFKQELHFIDDGKGKSIDGSKFVNKFGFDYEMSIWDVEINNT